MLVEWHSLASLLATIVDNRGRSCPTSDTGRPLVATNCIREDRLYPAYDTSRYVDEYTYQNWFRGHPRPGDLIFVTKGTPGRVCVAPANVDFCIAQDMVALRADQSRIYPKNLFAIIRSSFVQSMIEQLHVGTMILHFKKGDFDKLLLPIPTPHAQRFIGDLYFLLSEKIELNRRMGETLEGMARALFKSWFVDFDPVRAKAAGRDPGLPPDLAALFPDSFEDPELGEIPRGWTVGSFGEVAEQLREQDDPRTAPDAEFLHYSIPAFDEGQTPKQELGLAIKSGKWRVPRGCVLLSKLNPSIERVWQVDHTDADRAVASTEFLVLRPAAPFGLTYLYALARSANLSLAIDALVTGTSDSHQRARPEAMLGLPVIVPDRSVLRAYDQMSGGILTRVTASRRESRSLASLRDTLLPKLISGELRVPEAERAVEAVA